MLPGLDGFALMEHMQKYQIPVLYLTAKVDVSSKIKGLRDGAEDYLVKPFEVLELLVRIEKILERTGKLDKILRYRDIVLDQDTHTVTKSGVTVMLQPIEYDLMAALIRHKNCSLSRERLLSEIWGYDYLGTTRTVDTHMSNLRRKLDLAGSIVSVPKIGYRLTEE
jgi:DNA-binding response OmpR family regulator